MALLIDAVGTGLWTPLSLIFFTRAQHLPLDQTGTALTVGGLAGLLTGPLGGNLVDRWTPAPLVMISYLVRAVAFVACPLVVSVWQLTLLAAILSTCERLFWTSNTPMLERLIAPGELTRILGLQNALRVSGWVVGAGLAAALSAPLISHSGELRLLAYANGVSFLVAAALVRVLKPPPASAAAVTRRAVSRSDAAGWRGILSDRPFLLICLLQLGFALVSDSFTAMLPLVALDVLHGPSWLPGAALVASSLSLLLARKPAARYGEFRTPIHRLRLACPAFASAFLILAPAGALGTRWAVPVVLCAALVGTTGDALFAPVMATVANDASPPHLKGRYSATFQLAWGVGGVLAPVVGAGLLTIGNAVLWLTLTAVCGVTACLIGSPHIRHGT